MKTYFRFCWLIIILVVFLSACDQNELSENRISIIPLPENIEIRDGEFEINSRTDIFVGKRSGKLAKYLNELLAPATGYKFLIREYDDSGEIMKNGISVFIDTLLTEFGDEGYTLCIENNGVLIKASTEAGILYGIQSFRQILPSDIESQIKIKREWEVPCLEINDIPRFKWRGLMMDCSRTFWSKEYIYRTIRLMALYKMNTLHMHLTDDQGWRLEILKYPELAPKASRFDEKYFEPPVKQGFYTQYDMREIIAYAKSHNITIVPEIEMPGHSNALLSVYPDLACEEGEFEIFPFFKGPGITEDILCAGKEETFDFLEDVIDEIVELFPGEYIHIGGDEAPKTKWKECPECQERMKQEWLDNEDELQSYFIKRIASYIEEKGKKLIGWDEILEGGLAPGAAVMSWRGFNGGIEAAKEEHNVVMSPTSHCYFDYNYKTTSTKKVYSYEPVPDELDYEESQFILGAQANFWSHIDREEYKVDRQLFPRLLALSEVVWTSPENKNFEGFSNRLESSLSRMDMLGVNYYSDSTVIDSDYYVQRKGITVIQSAPNIKENKKLPIVFWIERIEEPRPLQLHFIKMDLRSDNYELVTMTGFDPDGTGPAEASLESPISLAERNSAFIAVNANAFRHLPGTDNEVKRKGWFEGLAVDIAGLVISDGLIISETEEKRTDFWMDKKGNPYIGKLKKPDDATTGVSDWGSLLLQEGNIQVEESEIYHPRTIIGSDKKGRYLYFVVADGRQKGYSEGISLYEAAVIMKDHGCYNAVNLDGGGSSIMLARVNGELSIMNKPSGGIRSIPVMLGIRSTLGSR